MESRSRSADVENPYRGISCKQKRCRSTVLDGPDGYLRWDCARVDDCRTVRSHQLPGESTYPGDRHPHGPGCTGGTDLTHGAATRDVSCRAWYRVRAGCFMAGDAIDRNTTFSSERH